MATASVSFIADELYLWTRTDISENRVDVNGQECHQYLAYLMWGKRGSRMPTLASLACLEFLTVDGQKKSLYASLLSFVVSRTVELP
jgi:hypothetical protein